MKVVFTPHFGTVFYLPECKGFATSVHRFYRQVFHNLFLQPLVLKRENFEVHGRAQNNFMHSAMAVLDLNPMK